MAAPAPRDALQWRFDWQPNAHEAPWLYLPALRGLWRTVVCAARARSLGLWRLPLPGVRCQGPPCCLRSLRCQGTLCWLAPCSGWCAPLALLAGGALALALAGDLRPICGPPLP
ncbi:hypothetical protein V6N13_040288 [Hibiscus sabdariffa]